MRIIIYLSFCFVFTSCSIKSSEYYNSEAEKLELEGKFYEAILLLDKAIEINPKNIYALINRAVDKSLLEDYIGAIEDYNKIIDIDEKNTLAYLNRGNNKCRIENYRGAIDDFNKAIRTKGSETFYFEKSDNYFLKNNREFDATMEEIRFARGCARYHVDSLSIAFDDFQFCIEKGFSSAVSYYFIGLIYIAYEMTEEGCIMLKRSRALGDGDAQEMIDKFCNK